MFDFPLYVSVPLADYSLSMRYEYQTYYVISSCLFASLTVSKTRQKQKHLQGKLLANIIYHISADNTLILS